jgi:hypothetical protein
MHLQLGVFNVYLWKQMECGIEFDVMLQRYHLYEIQGATHVEYIWICKRHDTLAFLTMSFSRWMILFFCGWKPICDALNAQKLNLSLASKKFPLGLHTTKDSNDPIEISSQNERMFPICPVIPTTPSLSNSRRITCTCVLAMG